MESLHIDVPERTASDLEQRVQETEFDSVEEYMVFVLEVVCEDIRESKDESNSKQNVEDRLESLGYL